jgi:murein DD-endopeptidase MepM/ murein hydrolase activator NlpD
VTKPGPFHESRVLTPCPGYGVSTPWGKRPNDHTYWQARGHHTGDDYAAPAYSPVLAVLDGEVRWRVDSVLGLIALLFTEVDGHPVTFWYCHLSMRTGAPGNVKAGDVIGRVGMTGSGASRGPHLHLEIRDGHTSSWAGRDYSPRW